MKTQVWLLNMGGPDSLESIQPFLRNLLADPHIVRMPWWLGFWFQPLFAELVSRKRAAAVRASYASMGGASPQLEIVREQARALQATLGQSYEVVPVFRYWGQGAREAAATLEPGQPVVLLSLYPHDSDTTVGSSMEDARRFLGDRPVVEIPSYPDFEPYIAALVDGIGAVEPTETLVFSAHGLPTAYNEAGDPYLDHVQRTVAAVMRHHPGVPHVLCFQSRVGRKQWLEPSAIDTLRQLTGAVVVVPVSFTSDHIETIVEIGEELRDLARDAGVTSFRRVDAPNTHPAFIEALAVLVRQNVDQSTIPRSEGR